MSALNSAWLCERVGYKPPFFDLKHVGMDQSGDVLAESLVSENILPEEYPISSTEIVRNGGCLAAACFGLTRAKVDDIAVVPVHYDLVRYPTPPYEANDMLFWRASMMEGKKIRVELRTSRHRLLARLFIVCVAKDPHSLPVVGCDDLGASQAPTPVRYTPAQPFFTTRVNQRSFEGTLGYVRSAQCAGNVVLRPVFPVASQAHVMWQGAKKIIDSVLNESTAVVLEQCKFDVLALALPGCKVDVAVTFNQGAAGRFQFTANAMAGKGELLGRASWTFKQSAARHIQQLVQSSGMAEKMGGF